jgi:glutathione S-transferase
MKLYFSRNPNPRLAVAVARHLHSPVEFEPASPFAQGQSDRFRLLNPNLSIPILVAHGRSLWETDAIACRLAREARSAFWPCDDREPDLIRWISWGKENFVRACDIVHFEKGTKRRYALGPTDQGKIEDGLRAFHRAAALLDAELATRQWLLGDTPTYADFRMATFLPFNDVAELPVEAYRHIHRWSADLDALPAWRAPFDGIAAPDLPPILA